MDLPDFPKKGFMVSVKNQFLVPLGTVGVPKFCNFIEGNITKAFPLSKKIYSSKYMLKYKIYNSLKDSVDFIIDCIKETSKDNKHSYGVKFEKALPWLVQHI